MTRSFAEVITTLSRKVLNQIKEVPVRNRLDWTQISRPLKEDSHDLANIHKPTIEEYEMTYSLDGKKKTCYDWWYSTILKDRKENIFFLILAFHPRWTFYRIVRVNADQLPRNLSSLPKLSVLGGDFSSRVGYSKHENAIRLWVSKSPESKSSSKAYAICTIKSGESHLALKTGTIAIDLIFTSLGTPFWVNRGREAICSPKGDTMSGFYDVSQVRGILVDSAYKTRLNGVGINEHLMSFTPPELFWKRIDGVYFSCDQMYCAFWHLESKVGNRQYTYKDGAVFLRASKDYLIPTDFEIEYLRFDRLSKVPVQICVHAVTTQGELNVVGQAFAETEKQVALRMIEGCFICRDGKKIELTNGYGQHALH